MAKLNGARANGASCTATVATLAVAAIASCSASHTVDAPVDSAVVDATSRSVDAWSIDSRVPALDAEPRRDARPADVWICPDGDGDDFADVRCGGDDCDDTDSRISPVVGICVGAATLRTCVAGLLADVPCPAELPHCDHRSNQCVPAGEACGDGVLHGGEQCDDGNLTDGDLCDHACRDEPCLGSTDCPPARPSCSDRRPDGHVYCRQLVFGEVLGDPCASDADCASTWCDLDQMRCTAACEADDDCEAVMGYCAIDDGSILPPEPRPWCSFGCGSSADCTGGTKCKLVQTHMRRFSRCWQPRGEEPVGTDCLHDAECASGECWHGANAGCTAVCTSDAECTSDDALGPRCRLAVVDHLMLPADWPFRYIGTCRSAGS